MSGLRERAYKIGGNHANKPATIDELRTNIEREIAKYRPKIA